VAGRRACCRGAAAAATRSALGVAGWSCNRKADTGTAEHDYRRWLLIRRSITGPPKSPTTCATAPRHQQRGTDPHRYEAWFRNITLAMWAHAFLAVTAAAPKGAATPNGISSLPSPR
jgi:hypothetical protein